MNNADRTEPMPDWNRTRMLRRLPGVLSVLAAAFVVYAGLVYLDSQGTAERRMALAHDAPMPQSISEIAPDGARMSLIEVRAVAIAVAPQIVRIRRGLGVRTVALYPLLAPSGEDRTIRGFAYVDAGAAGEAAVAEAIATGVWPGVLDARTDLAGAAQDAMRDAGYLLASATPMIALFDAPRAEVLARPVHSRLRPLVFWLAVALVLVRYGAAAGRIRRVVALVRPARHRRIASDPAAGSGTARTHARFDKLADDTELPEPRATSGRGLAARFWRTLRNLISPAE